ncbi:MAG: UvrD-helicase domain-containing protein [Gammaproteobacteria bacterium]|nr:UvrD-helicase domain-containing protein [Gammaproteobacteria bacterium]
MEINYDNISPELLDRLTDSQKMVIALPSSNILVNAGAGSGKTTVLTRRVIHLLKDLSYSLDDIIVLTFTDLAAKEMKDRIIKNLKNENNDRLKEELSHIDEANIMTFDAFCHKFLVQNSAYSIIPSSFNIGDSALFEMKLNEFLDEILIKYYKNGSLYDYIEEKGIKKSQDIKKELIEIYYKLLSELDPIQALNEYKDNYHKDSFFSEIESDLFNILRNKLLKLNDISLVSAGGKTPLYIDKLLEYKEELLNAYDLEDLISIIRIDLKKYTGFDRAPNSSKDSTDEEREAYRCGRDLFTSVIKDINTIIKGVESVKDSASLYERNIKYEDTYIEILKELFNRMDEFKKDYSIYSFQDIAIECIRILKENKNIQDFYKSHIKEILIDEYQDTNDINSILIGLISNNNEVVVGDVKQSIYRFRNANPNIFTKRYDDYEKGKGINVNLLENFRSRKSEVLDIVNEIFSNISTDKSIESSFFKESMIYGFKNYDKLDESKDLNRFNIIEYDPKDKNYVEADYIAQDIKNRIDNHQKTYDKDKNIIRDARYDDFLILAFSKNEFKDTKEALEKRGIPSIVMDEVSFSSSEEIIFLKSVLKLVDLLDKGESDSNDFNLTLLSILRSFIIKENDDTIARYILKDEKSNLTKFKELFPDLSLKMDKLIDTYKTYGISKLINEIVVEFDIYKKMFSLFKREEREIKLNIVINQIETYIKSGMSLSEIVSYFDYLKVNKIDTTAKISSFGNLNCVTIMTIHKSKGLEKPFVYIAKLRGTKNDSPIYNKKYGIVLKFDNSLKSIASKLYDKKERNKEFFRVLYVALTRARESLTLVVKEKNRTCNNDIYNFSDLFQFLTYKHEFNENLYRTIELDEVEDSKDELKIESNTSINYDQLSLKEKTLINKRHASHSVEILDDELNKALERGTLLHSYFEIVNFKNDIDEEIKRLNISDDVSKYLRNFKNSFLFSNEIEREFHELPFYTDDTNGIIDYAIETKDEFIIVDFKTKNIDNPAYVSQLNTYKEYISKRTDKEIKMYLYSIIYNKFKKIEES